MFDIPRWEREGFKTTIVRLILFITIFFKILLFAQSGTDTTFSYIEQPNKTYTLSEVVEKSDQGLFSPEKSAKKTVLYTLSCTDYPLM